MLLLFFINSGSLAIFYHIFRTKGLSINEIIDRLEETRIAVDQIYIEPPMGDDSDGYDDSDSDGDGDATKLTRAVLEVKKILPKYIDSHCLFRPSDTVRRPGRQTLSDSLKRPPSRIFPMNVFV